MCCLPWQISHFNSSWHQQGKASSVLLLHSSFPSPYGFWDSKLSHPSSAFIFFFAVPEVTPANVSGGGGSKSELVITWEVSVTPALCALPRVSSKNPRLCDEKTAPISRWS